MRFITIVQQQCLNVTIITDKESEVRKMKDTKNNVIREALIEAGIRQWELANMMGISEYTLCKRLRKEVTEEERAKMLSLIKGYKAGKAV